MPGIGIGIGLNRLRLVGGSIDSPTNLTASFDIPSISGQVSWVDNSGGTAQYEVYSSYNGNPYVFLGTTLAGATSYIDTTCKQNASVVYRIRAKKGSVYSEYATTSVINTPLCWKTDQTVRTNVVINALNTNIGKTINVDWGDGTNTNYTGSNYSITKIYDASEVNIFNIKITGDINEIVSLQHYYQLKSYGNLTNWVLPSEMIYFRISGNNFTGELFDITSKCTTYSVFNNQFTGNTPEIIDAEVGLDARLYGNKITGCATAHFRKVMTNFDVSNQNVTFSTANIDKLLKAAADWYQVNAPTANCAFNLSGANMGIPSLGVNNVDIVRLIGYYSAAGFAATVLVRTS